MSSILGDSIPFITTDYFDSRYDKVEERKRLIDGYLNEDAAPPPPSQGDGSQCRPQSHLAAN